MMQPVFFGTAELQGAGGHHWGTVCVLRFPGEDTYRAAVGTSGAAAHISGLAALMLAEQPSLTPAAIKTIIKESARPFVDSDCNTAKCGAGLADAAAALRVTSVRYGGMCVCLLLRDTALLHRGVAVTCLGATLYSACVRARGGGARSKPTLRQPVCCVVYPLQPPLPVRGA